MANLYTKTGDKGLTSLVGGSRVSKTHLRVDGYGTVDEANSMLGLARNQTENLNVKTYIRKIQGRLFALGSELASDEDTAKKLKDIITNADIQYLECIVDEITTIVGKQTSFVVPGENIPSATLHIARTIIRRAERKIVKLSEVDYVREDILKYVNRLSDAIYAMARLLEEEGKQNELYDQVTQLVKLEISKIGMEESPILTLDRAKRMAQRAIEKARMLNISIVFAAVDSGGNLLLLERMEDSLLGSIEIAIGKAYTSNAFKLPTHNLGNISQPGKMLYSIENSAPGKLILFGGGYPCISKQKIYGGIGISGGTVKEDMEIALYAMMIEGGMYDEYR